MNNHTPGPWKIVIDALSRADGTKRKWEVNERGTDVLVEVDGHGWHEVALDIDTPANARLIAAAPDLLEIIELALAWCEQDAENEDGYPTQEMMDNRVAVLRAAIEAVQGGEE